MNTPQDPWDDDRFVRIPELPAKPDFTVGEICFWTAFCVGVIGGLCIGGYYLVCWSIGIQP